VPQFAVFFSEHVGFAMEVVQAMDAGHAQDIARAQHPTGRLCQQHSLKAPVRCVRPRFRIVWTAITNKAGFSVNAIRGVFFPNSSESNRETYAGQAALVGNAALPGRCGEYIKYVISMY
jgi:hypothetical protein